MRIMLRRTILKATLSLFSGAMMSRLLMKNGWIVKGTDL
jgi:hypothetical protein